MPSEGITSSDLLRQVIVELYAQWCMDNSRKINMPSEGIKLAVICPDQDADSGCEGNTSREFIE